MIYEHEHCPGCRREMLEGEDIVVCPDCGAPQHRECWMQTGSCAYAAQHKSGFVWQPQNVPAQQPTGEQANGAQESPMEPCPVCGTQNPADALVCLHCGNSLIQGGPAPGWQVPPQQNPFLYAVREDPDEEIDGATVSDLASFVQSKAWKYIPRFKKMSQKKHKISFNGAAFFFGFYWFFYRKLYVLGSLFMGLQMAVALFMANASNAYSDQLNYFASLLDQGASEALLQEAYNTVMLAARQLLPFVLVLLVIQLAAGLVANAKYMQKAVKTVRTCRTQQLSDGAFQNQMLKYGGVSFLGLAVSMIIYQGLLTFFNYLATSVFS